MLASETLDVLVVDDSDFFVTVTADKLEDGHGISVRTAHSGGEALDVLADAPVDCVVSDYEMPELNGLELFHRVREEFGLPFVLVTGEGDEQVASDAISAGVDDYLRKDEVAAQERLELLANRIRNVVAQRRASERYERLVNNTPDEITHVSAEGEILAANEAMAMAFGTVRDDLVGQHLADVIPEAVARERLDQGQRAMTAGSAVTFQDEIGVRSFHNIAVTVTDGQGGGFQLISRDITEQKHRERELETKTEELALINRLVRHDINNDVQLVMAWAEAASEGEDPGKFLDRIHDVCEHIAELTGITGDFVDAIARDEQVDLNPVALDEALETEVEKKRSAFEDVTVEVPGGLPSVSVRANELLSSVFENLLSNAVRHNDTDHPEATVEVEAGDRRVTVRIADNGPGIPDDRKDEVFGRGEMGPDSPGTGIGLYLVRRLVTEYGGQVTVEDNDPRGAVFTVELRRHRDA